MRILLLAVIGLTFLVCTAYSTIPHSCAQGENSFPFCNTKLPLDERIKDLISRIPDEDKPLILTARASPKGNVSSIGLAAYDWGANCLHGVQSRCGEKCPTSFAAPNTLGSAWNISAIKTMGNIIGVELRALWLQGVGEENGGHPKIGLDCWSPNINIPRDPRWGRCMETPSEDPYLAGLYGTAYTSGLQEGPDPNYLLAVVTLKHWDAYSLERWHNGITRHNFDAKVSNYDLAATYFPAFKRTVTEGKAKGVMCSYNALNGIPTCANHFLNNTIRGSWGFDGYITSDSGAVSDIYDQHHYVKTPEEAAAAAILGGTDINSGSVYSGHLLNAVSQNLLKMSDVDNALYRIFKLRFELGLFDPIENQPYWHIPPTAVGTKESQEFNMFSTLQSLVLLKNDDNVLPLPRGKRIAVIGPHGNASYALVGNYLGQLCPDSPDSYDCIVSPYLAIKEANVGGSTVYVEGCQVNNNDTSGFQAALDAVKQADYVVLGVGTDQSVESEGHDRFAINLPGVQPAFVKAVLATGKPVVAFLLNGGTVAIPELKVGAKGIIEAFFPGVMGGKALSSVLFGEYNPGGKLAVTIYDADYVNQVDFLSMDMTKPPGRTYRYFTGTPLYPFGFGLSYTTFSLAWSVDAPHLHSHVAMSTDLPKQVETFSVNVTNTGSTDGDEVVQAYFVPQGQDSPLIKQLFGFERVHVKAGETVTVTFSASPSLLKMHDHDGNGVIYPGKYQLQFTNGVDQKLSVPVLVSGPTRLVEPFGS